MTISTVLILCSAGANVTLQQSESVKSKARLLRKKFFVGGNPTGKFSSLSYSGGITKWASIRNFVVK